MSQLANHATLTQQAATVKFHELMNACAQFRGERLGPEYGREIIDLVDFLVKRTSWLTSPASTKYHLCISGGLVIHSVNVTLTALKLAKALMPEIPTDSLILCGMMHDAGKIYSQANVDGTIAPRYLPNDDVKKPFKYNEGGNEIPLTVKDLLIPLKFVSMSDAEMQAIMLADGQYVDVNKDLAHHETPLACITHWADYWEGHVVEGQVSASWLSGLFKR